MIGLHDSSKLLLIYFLIFVIILCFAGEGFSILEQVLVGNQLRCYFLFELVLISFKIVNKGQTILNFGLLKRLKFSKFDCMFGFH